MWEWKCYIKCMWEWKCCMNSMREGGGAHCRANAGVVQRRTLEAIRHFAHLVNNIHHPRQSMHLRLGHVVNMLKALQSLSRRKELTAQNLPPTFPGMLKLGCVMQCFPSCDHSHFLCPVAIVSGKRLFYTRAVNREHQQIRRVFCLPDYSLH